MSSDPGEWRSAAAAEALARHVEVAPPAGETLVLADPDPGAERVLSEAGARVCRWSRVVAVGAVVQPWPPAGPWGAAAVRLPRSKDELDLLVHAAASVLPAGGTLLVYGANDEGIRSAPARIEPLFGEVATVSVKSRCRVLRAERPATVDGLRGRLEDWRMTYDLDLDGVRRSWASYPGIFSHGRLDPGTRLLLAHLEAPAEGSAVLDFGCGSGIIGGILAERSERLRLLLLDADAVALVAAEENVPEARIVLADGLAATGRDRFDLIVSNPPYHRGRAEDYAVLESLVRNAPRHLRPAGALALVAQRRLPVEELLGRSFGRVRRLGEDRTYRVWRAERPRAPRGSSGAHSAE